jgi:tetratricopeptide (TPR) repeat protein
MLDRKLQLDIRIVKFQDLIGRKPDRPFGYYGLGVQYMLSGKPNMADRMFTQALNMKPGYMPAILGKLEILLMEKKLVSAVRFYQKNSDLFRRKKIYIIRAQRTTGSLYAGKFFYHYLKTIRSVFVFNETIGALQRMFNADRDNPVVNLLLAMFFLKEDKENERAFILYNLCVNMEGIPDKLRWDLVKILSKNNPDILKDEKIAALFSSIPEGVLGNPYASFILKQFILLNDMDRIDRAITEFHNKNYSPDSKTMWQYIDFCRKNDIWNSTVFTCCQKLIEYGWIDRTVAEAVIELKNRKITEHTHSMDKILSLYGYI